MATLRKHARCPIHGKLYGCCGRAEKPNFGTVRKVTSKADGVERERCSPAELRRRRVILLQRQKNICPWCDEKIEDFRDAVTDHIGLRGLGGSLRDDSLNATRALHSACNLERGSQRYMTRQEMLAAKQESKGERA